MTLIGAVAGGLFVLALAVGFVVVRQRIVYRGECDERLKRYVGR